MKIILSGVVLRTTKLLPPFEKPTCSPTQARLQHWYAYVYTAQFIYILQRSFIINLISCVTDTISQYNNVLKNMIVAYMFSCCADEQQAEDNQSIDHASVRAHNDDTVSE